MFHGEICTLLKEQVSALEEKAKAAALAEEGGAQDAAGAISFKEEAASVEAAAAALSKVFPRSYLRRSLGVSLSEQQLQDRCTGLEDWLKCLLLLSDHRPSNDQSLGAAAAAAAAAETVKTTAVFHKPGIKGKIRRLLWERLGLHARVTHL